MMEQEKNLTGYASIDKPWLKNYPNDAVKDIYSDVNMSIYDFIKEQNKDSLDCVAMEYFGGEITYREMLQYIDAWAKAFHASGIGKGDFVSICLPNIPEIVYCFYALSRLGAVANFIDPRINPNGIKERLNTTKSKCFVVLESTIKEKVNLIIDNLPYIKTIVNISLANSSSVNLSRGEMSIIAASEFIAQGYNITDFTDVPYEENMKVSAIYTSGTTAGEMLAGIFSNENYNTMVKAMRYGSNYVTKGKRFLGVIPFFSAYGSFNGLHNSFSNSWTVVMVPQFNPTQFAKLIEDTKVNAALGVPQFWGQFTENKKYDLTELEIPVCGGDRISPASIEKINAVFKESKSKSRLKIGYGATEFGGCVATTSDEETKYNPQSVGCLLPCNVAMIIDKCGNELPYEEEGELCISGPTMMQEYFENSKRTEEITIYKNGLKFYRTGDIAKINAKGDIIFCDRLKRIIIRPDGHTVACSPIEDVLMTIKEVKDYAVVGLRNNGSESGEIPTAFIVLNENRLADMQTAKAIDAKCLENLGERERALAIVFVDGIPYTINGKVDFASLQNKALEEYTYFALE